VAANAACAAFASGSGALACTGRANGSTGRAASGTRGVNAVRTGGCLTAPVARAVGAAGSSAARRRWIARACSCDTRDSFTPSSLPISFIVTSLK
jgi:hypothetical protein